MIAVAAMGAGGWVGGGQVEPDEEEAGGGDGSEGAWGGGWGKTGARRGRQSEGAGLNERAGWGGCLMEM